MLKKWLFHTIIVIFIFNLFYNSFYRKKIKPSSIKTSSNINNQEYHSNKTEEKINKPLNYDKSKFDPEIIHLYTQSYETINDEDDDIVYWDNSYSKKYKIKAPNKDEDNDNEFENLIPKPKKRINVTINYNEKYQSLYDELSTKLDNNIEYLKFYPKIPELDEKMIKIKYILYIILIIVCLCCIFIEKIINCCCKNVSTLVKNFLSIIKFLLAGICYILVMKYVNKLNDSNLFEVYVNGELKYSTQKKDEPPTYIILFNILKSYKEDD